ncbi:MAG: hypothetical protein AAGK21_08360 [Bacteroidota bacterium]
MRALALGLATLVLVSGCASIEEAFGRPDPYDWTYFEEGSVDDVVDAMVDSFRQTGISVESVREEAEGAVLTISQTFDGSNFTEVLVQPSTVEGFESRAQLYLQSEPLPRWLEVQITSRL